MQGMGRIGDRMVGEEGLTLCVGQDEAKNWTLEKNKVKNAALKNRGRGTHQNRLRVYARATRPRIMFPGQERIITNPRPALAMDVIPNKKAVPPQKEYQACLLTCIGL
jgi:hypothetical protein